jgi:hypothetical protein
VDDFLETTGIFALSFELDENRLPAANIEDAIGLAGATDELVALNP